MTCAQCESDTAERDQYVTYGGVIFCNIDCLARWYLDNEHRFESPDEKLEKIESEWRVVEQ